MAPSWPEEVDVFSVPHSRMKKLVHKYSNMITTTDFRDELHLITLLKNLMNVFTEFKAHEQIENILIMKQLKNKLRAASVTSAAVCNCHSDNRLTDMLDLVEDGYRWAHKTEQERQMYGKKLMNALDVFTQNFIPHMEEEEEVFQPMLMQYFSYEELKELKAKVIYQHRISKQHEEYHHEKFVEDSLKCNWSFTPESMGGVDGQGLPSLDKDDEDEQETYVCVDEDADIDESGDSDETENLGAEGLKQILKEARMLTAIVKYLLPQVGSGVKVCDLAFSKGLSSSLVHKILKLCPNLEVLDLTHTSVGDIAFREFGASGRQFKLRHLDLTGCENITDLTLISLASMRRSSSCTTKDEENVEIENVPQPCAQKLRVCCGRSTTCKAHLSDNCCRGILGMKLSANKNCGFTEVETCSNHSDTSHDLVQSQDNFIMLQLVDSDSNDCSVRLDQGDPQTCDLDLLFMNLLLESDESLSSSNMNSFTDTFSDISLTPQLCCDNKGFMADLSFKESRSSLSQRTCSGAEGILEAFNEKRCCKNLNVSTVGNSVPHVLNSVGRCCSISDACIDANHKGPKDNIPNTGHRVCTLEFLSLNGCYRISDRGLSALAEGEGTPLLAHLDLSGCVAVTTLGLSNLVSTSQRLDHSNLFYCDNMCDDPYFTTASGCRNLQCKTRFCCSIRE